MRAHVAFPQIVLCGFDTLLISNPHKTPRNHLNTTHARIFYGLHILVDHTLVEAFTSGSLINITAREG